MVQIVVDAEMARQIEQSSEPIQICGPDGRILGGLQRPIFTEEEVAEALKRLDEPGELLSFEQVLGRLRELEAQCRSQ